MITVAHYEEDFLTYYENEKRLVVVYGVGVGYKKCKTKIPHIDLLIDKNSDVFTEESGLCVHAPEFLETINAPIYIIVTPMRVEVFDEICDTIASLNIDAIVFHAYNNIAFEGSFWTMTPTFFIQDPQDKLRVNLVCEEKGWILHKFANRMEEELKKMEVDVRISDNTEVSADINHHIQFASYHPYPNDTLMISHMDSWKLFCTLKKQLETARLGICMSKETMNHLVSYGIPRNKICYINPAHDGIIKPRKTVIGITHKTHTTDLRKRLFALLEITEGINPDYFRFIIMGSGWEKIITELKKTGFEVTYYPDFDRELYTRIVPTFDYYLFTGFDEGSMGYLDAVTAGVKTIVTPQGFHLDNDFPIDYPCRNVKEFHEAFVSIQKSIERRRWSVEQWTWSNYAKKHMVIWDYILKRKELKDLYADQLRYEDGIYSMLLDDNRISYDKRETR